MIYEIRNIIIRAGNNMYGLTCSILSKDVFIPFISNVLYLIIITTIILLKKCRIIG